MKELSRFMGSLIALGCLCAGLWHGWYGEYAAACYWLLLSIINQRSAEEHA